MKERAIIKTRPSLNFVLNLLPWLLIKESGHVRIPSRETRPRARPDRRRPRRLEDDRHAADRERIRPSPAGDDRRLDQGPGLGVLAPDPLELHRRRGRALSLL